MSYLVTVIIPTLARTARASELKRAVKSITSQADVSCLASVVVNGDVYDAGLLDEIGSMPGVQIHHSPRKGVSAARYHGRTLVETEYFGFIDDDDEFLPGAFTVRTRHLSQHPEVDVLITNGYQAIGGVHRIAIDRFDEYLDDPARALMVENWMHNCAGLFRTATVTPEVFTNLPNHLELTYLALRLSAQHTILRVNHPTYVIHEGAADRVSASMAYVREVPSVLEAMLRETNRDDIRHLLRERLRDNLHVAADAELTSGNRWASFRYHLKSLFLPGGLRYLPFTRHLVMG